MFGQVTITNDDDAGAVVNGDTVFVNAYETLTEVHLSVENISGASIDYKWRRTILNTNFATVSDQLCDDDICYPCSGTTWVTASVALTRANGASTIFKPRISSANAGEIHMRYYMLDGGNGDALIDSVDVKVTSFLSVEKSAIDFSVYPNPANDELNISISENNTSISIFDIVGKNVSQMNLVNGNNTLNIENLNAGVYFYSIKRNGNVIETKKLVVR